MSAASLITTTVDFEREGLQQGHLRVPHSRNSSAYGHIPIPIVVARHGNGPTLLLTGGTHGDEYEGPVALMRLMRDLPIERVNGRIIIIPALNFPAFLSGTRLSPIDGLNLNRQFPGNRNGSPTAMIAHYVESILMPMTDYCFDFHAGGASLRYLPTLIVDRPKTEQRRTSVAGIIEAFNPPRVLYMDMLGEDRTIAAAAAHHDVPFFTGEFGGAGSLDPDGLEIVVRGLSGVLNYLGAVRGGSVFPATPRDVTRRLSVKGAEHYIFATRDGVFEPCFRLGDEVVKGQLAGYIHDPHVPWQMGEEIRFSAAGMVVCMRTQARVEPGDCIGHLAGDEP